MDLWLNNNNNKICLNFRIFFINTITVCIKIRLDLNKPLPFFFKFCFVFLRTSLKSILLKLEVNNDWLKFWIICKCCLSSAVCDTGIFICSLFLIWLFPATVCVAQLFIVKEILPKTQLSLLFIRSLFTGNPSFLPCRL